MRKLLPLLLALIGLACGVGAGLMLRPHEEPQSDETPEEAAPQDREYVKLPNQFVVPVLQDGRVSAMVVMALSLEVSAGQSEAVFSREPKIRDAFLQVLFDHANSGGFRGSFTDGSNLILLRRSLHEAARETLGDIVSDVLITEIGRQDS